MAILRIRSESTTLLTQTDFYVCHVTLQEATDCRPEHTFPSLIFWIAMSF